MMRLPVARPVVYPDEKQCQQRSEERLRNEPVFLSIGGTIICAQIEIKATIDPSIERSTDRHDTEQHLTWSESKGTIK